MAAPRRVRGGELAAQLVAAGVKATDQASAIQALAPAVLVQPPSLEFSTNVGAVATWRLLAVSSTQDQDKAWDQLDEIVDQVAAVLFVETALPASYSPSPDVPPVAAYVLTFTETVE